MKTLSSDRRTSQAGPRATFAATLEVDSLPLRTTSTSRSLRSPSELEGEAWRSLAARTARVARELSGRAVAEPASDCRLRRLVGRGVGARVRALLRARHV